MNQSCPCGSSKSLAACCGRFLSGAAKPRTPEQLMRSRFTAYALGGYGEYLLSSWFPATARGLTAESLSEKNVDWQRLDVIGKSQQGDAGTVEFKAFFRHPDDPGQLQVMHELSEFKRVGGRWFYVGGRVT